MLLFSDNLDRNLSYDVHWGHNSSFFGLGPWAIIHGWQILLSQFLMIPFERSLSKLSENR